MGEDLEIDKILGYKKNGFYIDIGANDPVRFNNTNRFYKKGWQGINIEPNPNVFKNIDKARIRDTNLNLGIASEKGNLTFYSFFPDTLSTFSEHQAKEYLKEGFELLEKVDIPVDSLNNVLNKYALGKEIDFLTVDTESFDFIVLDSNDWERFSPKVICIEYTSDDAKSLLEKNGYKKVFDNGLNMLYSKI